MIPLHVLTAALPHAPPDIAEEVELFARKSRRTAKLHYVPMGGWMARFSLRCNDPRMKLYQEGKAPEPPTEDVWFHRPNPKAWATDGTAIKGTPQFVPLDIYQMGRSGVREFLERGDTWSGRGVHGSLEEAAKASAEMEETRKARIDKEARERAMDIVKDRRRSVLKIPFIPGGITLRRNKEST